MMRGDMSYDNRAKPIPGTDVTHFFSLSPNVGQRGQEYCAVSMWDFDNGSPGWIRTSDHSINSRMLYH
jgi:hypothetical protein